MEPCATLVEPSWNLPQTSPDHPTALEEIGGTLVEPRGTLPQTTPDHPAAHAEPLGTLLQQCWNLHGTLPCKTWWNSSGTEPWWNPGASSNQTNSKKLVNPGGTLVRSTKGWWNLVEPSCGTLPQTTPDQAGTRWNTGGNMVENWWNPCRTLVKTSSNQPGRSA